MLLFGIRNDWKLFLYKFTGFEVSLTTRGEGDRANRF